MRRTLLLIAMSLAACASTREALNPDYVAVARLGLAQAERSGHLMVVVVPDDLPPQAVAALASLRKVVPLSKLEKRPGYIMLPGYFYLQTLTVRGTHAFFAGTSGEVLVPPPGMIQLNCGWGPSLTLEKRSGQWAIALGGVMAC